VREYATIQQFPDGYQFTGSTAQKYKQIGNAVPVGLGRAVGGAVKSVIATAEANGQRRLFDAKEKYLVSSQAGA
jgi:hypothetical protein